MNILKQILCSILPKIDRHAIPLILWNLFPLMGVLLAGWKPESVFICFALETVIVGIFNVFRLMAVVTNGKEGSGLAGVLVIPFFFFHFSVFAVMQLSGFFLGTQYEGIEKALKYILYNRSYNIALGVFVLNCVHSFIYDFILTGIWRQRTMGEQVWEPYQRIFLQQIAVIGGFYYYRSTGNGYPLLIIFVVLKMVIDLYSRASQLETNTEAVTE